MFYFRSGSVIASFSMIFNVPQYDLISPLLEVINKMTGPEEVNKLGNMAIQVLEVDPLNGGFRFKHVIVKWKSLLCSFYIRT